MTNRTASTLECDSAASHVATFDVLGIGVRLTSVLPEAIELIDRSFSALRSTSVGGEIVLDLARADGSQDTYTVTGADGTLRTWATAIDAGLDLMEQLVLTIVSGLHRRGMFAIHAGVVAHRGRVLILAGPSGAGKTTLTLALAARGLQLLSDELAIVDPRSGMVHPYRRALHVRPETAGLVDGLAHLVDRPREELGGGVAWAVGSDEWGTTPGATRLGSVLILQPRDGAQPSEPILRALPAGLCAVELLRGTWAASADFGGALAAVGAAVAGARCATLLAAAPMQTADAIISWLDGEADGA